MGPNKTLQDNLYDNIRKLIIELELKPGERINIEDIASKLGVSRTPVREVLQRLKTEGLIKFIPRIGPVVVEISQKEIKDAYVIRLSLEKLAVDQAIKFITQKDISNLERILAKTHEMLHKQNSRKVAELNKKFHFETYRISQNPLLEKYLEDVYVKIERYMNILSREDKFVMYATEHHEMIYNYLKEKDCKGVQAAIKEHLDFSCSNLISILNNKYYTWLKADFSPDK